MLKELRLYPKYVSMSLKSSLSYKTDAILQILCFAVTEAISLATIYLIVGSVPSVGVWTFSSLAVLFGFTLIPKAIDHIFFDDLWIMAYWAVRMGELDPYLTRPMSPLFQFVAKTFKWAGSGELVVGIVIMSVFAPTCGAAWTASAVSGIIICAVLGIFVFTGIKLLFASLAFWVKSSGVLLNTVYNFCNYAKYPLGHMGKAFVSIMFYVVPFGLFLYYPVECAITGANVWWAALYSAIGAIIIMTLALSVWKIGIKHYDSVGN